MLGDMKPFKMVGNLYFVGTYRASSHLIDTGDGLILIDSGYAETADVIVESVTELGFDIKDVKYILHSHGHSDHTDGTPRLLELTKAETFLGEGDVKYISGWAPNHFYQDGQVITLGNTNILCIATPGHTEGTFSFFFNVEENGQTYRAGMFGGAGTNQLKKPYLNRRKCSWLNRGLYFKSVERLKKEHVDVFVGNHTWNNKTKGKYETMLDSVENPFINDAEWVPFLEKCEKDAESVILNESRELFVNYAHRGASEYAPENTFSSFYLGLLQGANGIETDVQATKDGVLVLFHDDTLERVTDSTGKIADYTWEELQKVKVYGNSLRGFYDRIPTFRAFLEAFAEYDIHFAIELKEAGVEQGVVDMIHEFGIEKKTTITSFKYECIKKVKEIDPGMRVGYLVPGDGCEFIEALQAIGGVEMAPRAGKMTEEGGKKKVFKMAPIHHHFEMCGWNENKIVAVFTTVSTIGCAIGVALMALTLNK